MVTEPPGGAGSFVFTGIPDGVAAAGESLEATDLQPATYTSRALDTAPQFTLVDISCDDQNSRTPSVGDVQARTVTFEIDPDESVNCVFTYALRPIDSGSTSGVADGTDPVPGGDVDVTDGTDPVPDDTTGPCDPPGGMNPFASPDDYPTSKFPLPADLPASAGTFAVPRAGG